MKEFWSGLTSLKKILLVLTGIGVLLAAVYFFFIRGKDGEQKDGETADSKPPAFHTNSVTGSAIQHNPNINTQTVPAPRTPVKSTDPQMRELIMNLAMSLAGDPLRAGDLRVEKSIGLNAVNTTPEPVKTMMSTILSNIMKIDLLQPRTLVFLSDQYNAIGGTDFRRDLEAAAAKLKNNDFNIKVAAWNIAPLQNGASPAGTFSFEVQAKSFKMKGLTGLQASAFFTSLVAEIDRYNREIKNAVIQELRQANPPYRFSDYGDN